VVLYTMRAETPSGRRVSTSTTSASSPYRGPPGEFEGVGSKPPSRSPVRGFKPAATRVDPRPRALAGTDENAVASASASPPRPARPTPDLGDDRGRRDALGAAAAAAAAANIVLADEPERSADAQRGVRAREPEAETKI
jgi:hypothetical protein